MITLSAVGPIGRKRVNHQEPPDVTWLEPELEDGALADLRPLELDVEPDELLLDLVELDEPLLDLPVLDDPVLDDPVLDDPVLEEPVLAEDWLWVADVAVEFADAAPGSV